MNWIKNYVRPKIRSLLGQKRDTPENMWIKDPDSGQLVLWAMARGNNRLLPVATPDWTRARRVIMWCTPFDSGAARKGRRFGER